jgi:hypothetical protein
MHDNEAVFWIHVFVMAAYFTPLLGALIGSVAHRGVRSVVCPTTPPAIVAGGTVLRQVKEGRCRKPVALFDPVSLVEG